MRNASLGILSFASTKWGKAVVFSLVLVAMVVGLAFVPATPTEAASCYSMPAYTTRTGAENKPTVLVYWNKPGHPDANKLKLYYQSKLLQTPSVWTVDTRYPQYDSGGWIGYYIATRWILSGNLLWDEDFRWKASYCP